jgi:hypothetical protein
MVALSHNTDAELVVENCRRKRLLITVATTNCAGDRYESVIFMIEARPPADITPHHRYLKR